MRRVRALLILVLLATAILSSACRSRPDATPEGAVQELLRASASAGHDPSAAAQVYALLAPSSRRSLEDRARRATAITGKPVSPEQMLVASWTPIRFEIVRTTTRVDGDRATVELFGPDPGTQHASIPLEREGEAWRIVVVVPPVAD